MDTNREPWVDVAGFLAGDGLPVDTDKGESRGGKPAKPPGLSILLPLSLMSTVLPPKDVFVRGGSLALGEPTGVTVKSEAALSGLSVVKLADDAGEDEAVVPAFPACGMEALEGEDEG